MLAVVPGNFLDDHGFATEAIDAPHRIHQEDQESPEGDEFVTPFRELIVTGRGLVAARANRGRTFARPHRDLDTLVVLTESGVLIDKSPEVVAAVQNCD